MMDDDDAADGRGSQAHIMRLGRSQIVRLEDSVGSLQKGAYPAAFVIFVLRICDVSEVL